MLLTAAADAPLAAALVDVIGSRKEGPRTIEGHLSQRTSLVRGDNNREVWNHYTDRLAAAVTDAVPFHIEIVPPKVPLVQNGSMGLKVVATREPNFKAPIVLRLLYSPPGVSMPDAVTIPEGQTAAVIPLTADGGAAIRTWKIAVLGEAAVGDGPVMVSSHCRPGSGRTAVPFRVPGRLRGPGAADQSGGQNREEQTLRWAGHRGTLGPAQRSDQPGAADHQGFDGDCVPDRDHGQFAARPAQDVALPGGGHLARRADHAFARGRGVANSKAAAPQGCPGETRADPAAATSASPAQYRLAGWNNSAWSRRPMQGKRRNEGNYMKRASAAVIVFCCYLGLCGLPGTTAAAIARLDVFPAEIHLQTSLARQQIIVVATRPDGVTEEVTARAAITPPDAKLVRMDGSTLYPVADGQTVLRAAYDGQTAAATVSVKAEATSGTGDRLSSWTSCRSSCGPAATRGRATDRPGARTVFAFRFLGSTRTGTISG